MDNQQILKNLIVQAKNPATTPNSIQQSSQGLLRGVVPSSEVDWQPWTTLKGTGAAATRIVMGSDRWIDVGSLSALTVRIEVAFITAGTTLRGETAASLDGPWRDVILQTSQGAATYVLGTEPFGGTFTGSTAPLRRYLRWAVQPPAGDWVICFRIGLASPNQSQLILPKSVSFADYGTNLPETGFGIMQGWTTVTGSVVAAGDDIIAPEHYWLDLSREVYGYVEVQTLDMNNGANAAELIIESAMYREGPWTTVIGPLSTDNTTQALKLTMEGPYAVALQRYVRWRLTATAAPWHACFRVAARWA